MTRPPVPTRVPRCRPRRATATAQGRQVVPPLSTVLCLADHAHDQRLEQLAEPVLGARGRYQGERFVLVEQRRRVDLAAVGRRRYGRVAVCLLYTSDAADDLL